MLQDVPTMLGGRYRVVERLGRGGMADVYRAEDVVLGRTVAVKVFRGGLEREAHLARFRAEVRTLAQLTHPHLVALYDAGGEIDEPWCAMEYVDGGSLADREAPLPAGSMARYGEQLAAALAYVHDCGIVHRDVKPSNVLLGSDDVAFLSDFGIARLVDGTRMTQSGLMIGTAAYLSPEQVRGEPAGPPADVYALALVLLEGITGRREYPGSPVESAVSRLSRPPAVPDDLAAGWAELLTAMTAPDAAGRPTAAAVGDRLAAIARRSAPAVDPVPPGVILLPPVPPPGRGGPGPDAPSALSGSTRMLALPVPRRRGMALLAGVGVAGALALLVPFTGGGDPGAGATVGLAGAPVPAAAGGAASPSASDDRQPFFRAPVEVPDDGVPARPGPGGAPRYVPSLGPTSGSPRPAVSPSPSPASSGRVSTSPTPSPSLTPSTTVPTSGVPTPSPDPSPSPDPRPTGSTQPTGGPRPTDSTPAPTGSSSTASPG